jgi:hypothetical protein
MKRLGCILSICHACADKLRAVRDAGGDVAMVEAMGALLCKTCIARIPGFAPGLRPAFKLKRKVR